MHTINPRTGYPIEHSLLSASVIAEDCMTADAFATAFMVVGVEKAIEIAEAEASIEVFLIFEDSNGELQTFQSEGINPMLMSNEETK